MGVSCKLASEGECFIACQLVFPIFFFFFEVKCRDSRAGFCEPCASSELLGRAVWATCGADVCLVSSQASSGVPVFCFVQWNLALLGLVPLDCVV